MTINLANNTPRVSYDVAEGVTTTSFDTTFEFFDAADLNVYVDGSEKDLTTDYTVSGGDGAVGAVAISVTGATGGSTVVITRDIELKRTTDFPASGPFQIGSLNTELDKLIAIAADLDDKASRALQLTDFDSAVSLVLPDVDTRKGTVLAFNSTTGAVESGPKTTNVNQLADIADDIGTLADIEDGTDATDAIQKVAAIDSNVTTVAGIDGNVTAVAGIQDKVTTVANDATDIGTVAGISGDVTAVANISSDIQTVEDNIAAIQGAAGNATTATNKATEAAASATEAEAWASKIDGEAQTGEGYSSKAWAIGGTGVTDASGSGSAKEWATDTTNTCDGTEYSAKEYAIGTQSGQTAGSAKQWALGGGAGFDSNTAVSGSLYSAKYWAEQAAASADSFDDTYLGPKSSDPSADNDGDALTAGDIYFSTTTNKLRVYDGSNWNDAVTDLTGVATNGFAIAMAIAL